MALTNHPLNHYYIRYVLTVCCMFSLIFPLFSLLAAFILNPTPRCGPINDSIIYNCSEDYYTEKDKSLQYKATVLYSISFVPLICFFLICVPCYYIDVECMNYMYEKVRTQTRVKRTQIHPEDSIP